MDEDKFTLQDVPKWVWKLIHIVFIFACLATIIVYSVRLGEQKVCKEMGMVLLVNHTCISEEVIKQYQEEQKDYQYDYGLNLSSIGGT